MTTVCKIARCLKAGLLPVICVLLLSADGIALAQSPGVTARRSFLVVS